MALCLNIDGYPKQDDVREGETAEEALQRRIEEGKIGKGKTLRRWKDTEEKVCNFSALAAIFVVVVIFNFCVLHSEAKFSDSLSTTSMSRWSCDHRGSMRRFPWYRITQRERKVAETGVLEQTRATGPVSQMVFASMVYLLNDRSRTMSIAG